MKKQLGLQKRMIIIFAIFIVTVSILQTVLAGSIVRRAITAKVMELLQNKAITTAEKIDHEIEDLSFWLEGVADTPVLFDESLTIQQRLQVWMGILSVPTAAVFFVETSRGIVRL